MNHITAIAANRGLARFTVPRPAWTSAIGVDQLKAIAGTSGAGGADVDAYCGGALNYSTNEILFGLCGGHYNGYDNRLVGMSLLADTLSWSLRKASSLTSDPGPAYYDQPYNADGTPTARHTYDSVHFVPQQNRLMFVGNYGAYGGPGGGESGSGAENNNVMDGFNLDTNTFDPAGTWPWPASSDGFWGYAKAGPTGDIHAIWGAAGQRIYRVATNDWITPTVVNQQSAVVKMPWAWNSTSGYLFGLTIGDGHGAGTDVRAIKQVRTNGTTVTQTAITFNASAAYTQFQADLGAYAAMDWNPTDGYFLWYAGDYSNAGHLYKITPNPGTAWDMEILSPAAGSDALPATGNNTLNRKMWFVTLPGGVEGFAIFPAKAANMHFLRTA
jgi:hypothetical protein